MQVFLSTFGYETVWACAGKWWFNDGRAPFPTRKQNNNEIATIPLLKYYILISNSLPLEGKRRCTRFLSHFRQKHRKLERRILPDSPTIIYPDQQRSDSFERILDWTVGIQQEVWTLLIKSQIPSRPGRTANARMLGTNVNENIELLDSWFPLLAS